MYLKKIALSRIQDGDFIIIQDLVADAEHPYRFQYSGTVKRAPAVFYLNDWTIEKFKPSGEHIRTTHSHVADDTPLLCVFESVGTSCFKVVTDA